MKKKLQDLVYNYKTKYEHGFTGLEIQDILNKFPDINMDKYNDAMYCNTCMMVDGLIITYHCDLLLGLCCGLENRSPTFAEWD